MLINFKYKYLLYYKKILYLLVYIKKLNLFEKLNKNK